MSEQNTQYLREMEEHGAKTGWVTPVTQEDRDFLAHFRAVCKRYNIKPSQATKLEYDFVTKVTESEFYLRRANA